MEKKLVLGIFHTKGHKNFEECDNDEKMEWTNNTDIEAISASYSN